MSDRPTDTREPRRFTVSITCGPRERQYRIDAAGVAFRRYYRPGDDRKPWSDWRRVAEPASEVDLRAIRLIQAAWLDRDLS
jgi:hypothetical protein